MFNKCELQDIDRYGHGQLGYEPQRERVSYTRLRQAIQRMAGVRVGRVGVDHTPERVAVEQLGADRGL
jgi:hypothetical protein